MLLSLVVIIIVHRPGYESVSSSSAARRNATIDRHAGNVSASTSQATSVSPVAHTSSLSALSTQDTPSTRTFSIGSSLRRRVSTPCSHHNHHSHHRPSSMVAVTTDHEVSQENG